MTDHNIQVLPCLMPRSIANSASILGVHTEGPYLHPEKKGCNDSSLFQSCDTDPRLIYGASNMQGAVKLITLAPELPNSTALINTLTSQKIKVSMGHTTSTYEDGLAGLKAGATCLTHALNAMTPLTSRAPGIAGLISLPAKHNPPAPYYTLIADGEHLHPSIVSILHRTNPRRSILVSGSTELTSLPDGTYPGNSHIPFEQTKLGNKVTIKGTDTLIGGCIPLQQSVRNLMEWTGCGLAEAVGTVTENVAGLMGIGGEGGRGVLKEGRRADLTVLNEAGEVMQTWVAGAKVWDQEDELRKREDDGEARG